VITAPPEGGEPTGLVAFSARALGSALRLTVHLPEAVSSVQRAVGQAAADTAWAAVQVEFDAVGVALSRFRDDSELTMLNRLAGSGQVVEVSWRTRRALAAIDRAGRMTDGRFDASVLGALERIGEHGARLEPALAPGPGLAPGGSVAPGPGLAPGRSEPPGPSVAPAVGRGDAGDRRSRVHAPPVPVDMGGIGKGLALRWACARALQSLPDGAGLQLEAGGDVVAGGIPPDDGWLIGVEDPAAADSDADAPLAVVELRSGAVATSSVRVRRWVGPDGRVVHHLIDPRTGEPAQTGLIAVTVAGADPAWAEVWSKALFLAGRTGIAAEARSRDLAAWWITDEGRLGLTPAARMLTAWAAEDRLG
jgi:thiamine biosynthesis lipoprotein